MARRRKAKTRTIYARPFKRAKRSKSRSGGMGEFTGLLGAGVYGALREKVSTQLSPLLANVPGGAIADEIGMLGVNWAVGKFIGRKVPMIRQVTKAGMLIEASRIGQALALGTTTTSPTARIASFR